MPPTEATRILFVFGWLVVGGEETEVRHLARLLPRDRYRIDVVACLRRDGMPEQTHRQLRELQVDVDTTPYSLSFDDTVSYLAARIPQYDVIVACQAVPDVVPAIELAAAQGHWVPPLIEHGGLVAEAEARDHDIAARYVGVCRSIRDAAAVRMAGRERDALEIPSMVDLDEFMPAGRDNIRVELDIAGSAVAFGWIGRLDRKKRVEDFIAAASILNTRQPGNVYLVIGGPDAFMPEYADELREQARAANLGRALRFLGDRDDVPRLLAALDVVVWLAGDEGMPHVISEAGAAGLAVIATRDNGTLEQIEDGRSGLFVPHRDPVAAASAMERLINEADLRARLGSALRKKVEQEFATSVVVPQWERLFDEVTAERPRPCSPSQTRVRTVAASTA